MSLVYIFCGVFNNQEKDSETPLIAIQWICLIEQFIIFAYWK